MQHSIYYRLISPKVRDLYWLLFSESPLHPSYDLSPYALFPQTVLNEWEALSTEYFLELDKNPQSINQFVDRKKNKRLGFYAEALLSFLDRKSTRLNSSHVRISYAVFCLKKK